MKKVLFSSVVLFANLVYANDFVKMLMVMSEQDFKMMIKAIKIYHLVESFILRQRVIMAFWVK